MRISIKIKDLHRVSLYMDLTDAMVTVDGGEWVVDTPKETRIYETTAELMEDVNAELEEIKEIYTGRGDLAEYKEAEKRAAKVRRL